MKDINKSLEFIEYHIALTKNSGGWCTFKDLMNYEGLDKEDKNTIKRVTKRYRADKKTILIRPLQNTKTNQPCFLTLFLGRNGLINLLIIDNGNFEDILDVEINTSEQVDYLQERLFLLYELASSSITGEVNEDVSYKEGFFDKLKSSLNLKTIGMSFGIASLILVLGANIMAGAETKSLNALPKISYQEFQKKVKDNEVKQLGYMGQELVVNGAYRTENPGYENFRKEMLEKDISFNQVQTKKELASQMNKVFGNLLIVLAPLCVFYYFFSKMTMPVMGKGNEGSGKDQLTPVKSSIKFSDIAGNKESLTEIKNLVNFLKNPKEYEEMGAKMPKGYLLYGPPGTGKTLMAKAIAGESGVPMISMNGSSFINTYVGVGASKVRQLFAAARKNAPCIIFIDEIDAIAGNRNNQNGTSEHLQTLNALLAEMDGLSGNTANKNGDGVVILGATNLLESMDPALLRGGRFDRQIALSLPDEDDRLKMLQLHFKNKTLDSDISLENIAGETIGFSGADIASFANHAAILAVNHGNKVITRKDIDQALLEIITKGHEQVDKEQLEETRRITAYHEAGHAVLSLLMAGKRVPKVTIIPSTSGYGGVTFSLPKEGTYTSKKDLENDICVMYGGRVGEQFLLKDLERITIGASSDIQQATNIINNYLTRYGFSEYGMYNLDPNLDREEILKEAKKMSERLYNEAYNFILEHQDIYVEIAESLLRKESLNADELNRIVAKHLIEDKEKALA